MKYHFHFKNPTLQIYKNISVKILPSGTNSTYISTSPTIALFSGGPCHAPAFRETGLSH